MSTSKKQVPDRPSGAVVKAITNTYEPLPNFTPKMKQAVRAEAERALMTALAKTDRLGDVVDAAAMCRAIVDRFEQTLIKHGSLQ